MKRPLCRLISVALIVLCSINTSNAKNRHAGVHTGPHYETPDAAHVVEAKASKPEQLGKHHAGNGGKHDTGVDGKHPVKTNSSKTGKVEATASASTLTSGSLETQALSLHTTMHHTATKQKDTKSAKTTTTSAHAPSMSYVHASNAKSTKKDSIASASMSYAKSHKDSASDSKADKGFETAKSYKPAPNEYNGVKMVVKTPEAGYTQPKSGKVMNTSSVGESGESSAKPVKESKSGKSDIGESDESLSSVNSTMTEVNTTVVSSMDPPVTDEATTATTAATEAATEAAAPAPEAATTPATEAVKKAPKVPQTRIETSPDEPEETGSPTYSPTSLSVEQTSSVEETFTAMDPFGLRFVSSKPQPRFNLDTVTTVTTEHLLHSFRTKGWDADRLKLMLLDEEDRRRGLRKLDSFPVYELVFGGVLYFKTTTEMPTKEEENALVEESFTGARLNYFVNLLKEEGVDIASASWGHLATSNESSGGSGNKLAIILGSVFGSIALFIAIALAVRVYNKRARRIQDGDRPNSLVFRIKEEVESMMDSQDDHAPTLPSSIDANEAPSRYSFYSKQRLMVDPVSPLDIPDDTASTSTRYVSVFTVKKDCGGKTLDQVDLRSLAVAYLSRLFKKVPDTNLLPYDKESQLPAIQNIRNIPDDLQELLEYVGSPRIDENTGKVMFNLRCESDVPMSKMKNLSSQKLPKQMSKSTGSEDRSPASGFEDVSL